MRSSHAGLVVGLGALATVAVALVTLGIGVIPVPAGDVAEALGDLARGVGRRSSNLHCTTVVEMRLPRAVGAICAGGALGTAGCMLQALPRNPLARPFVIGSAQASGFGAMLAIFFALPATGTLGLAFGMSILATLLVLSLARTQRSLPTESVVLTGLSVSPLFGALIGLMRFLARDQGVLARMALWIPGGLRNATWAPLALLAPLTVVAIVASLFLGRRLDLLALGEVHAQRLGMRVQHVGVFVLVLACLLSALAARFCDQLALLDGGRIVAHGSPEAVLTPETVRSACGVEASIRRCESTGSLQVVPLGLCRAAPP